MEQLLQLILRFQMMQKNSRHFLDATNVALNTYNKVSEIVRGENLMDEKLSIDVSRAFYSYFMSDVPGIGLNEDGSRMTYKEKRDLVSNMAVRIDKMKKSSDKDDVEAFNRYDILKYLDFFDSDPNSENGIPVGNIS